MNREEALRIVSSLADGHNPETGEVLEEGHILQQPNVVRALCLAADALQNYTSRSKREKRLPAHAGLPWTEIEDKQLASAFDAGAAVGDLATEHQRTEGAIKARLIRLGKLDASTNR